MTQEAARSNTMRLGAEAIAQIATAVIAGAPLLKCQLLACQFFDALRQELSETAEGDESRGQLAAAIDQCQRAARLTISPAVMLAELDMAVSLVAGCTRHPKLVSPPALRVIQGGRS
jgi:hypothetical protein